MIPLTLTSFLLLILPHLAGAVIPQPRAVRLPSPKHLAPPPRITPSPPTEAQLTPRTPTQRFNCPDVPAPSWVSQTDYPRLFRFCISFDADCDCLRDPRIPGRENFRASCNIENLADRHDVQLQRAIRVCENSCFCYGGPASNWERWPTLAPPGNGPLLGENSGWVGNH